MLNLLLKDFRLMFSGSAKLSERIISAVFTVLFIGCFVAVEWFVFSGIISKISDVAGAKESFLCVFLFVIIVLSTVSCVMSAKKLFFDPKDVELLSNRPVQSGQIISSKLVLLFLVQTSAAFMFEYPLFIAYGVSECRRCSILPRCFFPHCRSLRRRAWLCWRFIPYISFRARLIIIR